MLRWSYIRYKQTRLLCWWISRCYRIMRETKKIETVNICLWRHVIRQWRHFCHHHHCTVFTSCIISTTGYWINFDSKNIFYHEAIKYYDVSTSTPTMTSSPCYDVINRSALNTYMFCMKNFLEIKNKYKSLIILFQGVPSWLISFNKRKCEICNKLWHPFHSLTTFFFFRFNFLAAQIKAETFFGYFLNNLACAA